jgi:hypothetical protein
MTPTGLRNVHLTISRPKGPWLRFLANQILASIANDWYRKNELAGYEGYYVSIFYSYFAAPGLDASGRPHQFWPHRHDAAV